MNLKFRSKFNHVFTSHGHLHCAILKVLYNFKVKKALEARDPFLNYIFEMFKILKNNMKFTRAACWINTKVSDRQSSTTLMIFLCCYWCWLLLCCNYWRSLTLWHSTSWNCLNWLFQYSLLFIHTLIFSS